MEPDKPPGIQDVLPSCGLISPVEDGGGPL